jgi:hypothetical protein
MNIILNKRANGLLFITCLIIMFVLVIGQEAGLGDVMRIGSVGWKIFGFTVSILGVLGLVGWLNLPASKRC